MANPVRMPGTVIVLDDDPDVLTAARLLLTRHFEQVVTLSDPAQLAGAFGPECVALLLDMNFALGTNHGSEGLALLEQIRSRDEHVAVVLATAYGDIELAVTAMKSGASDFVLKPWENEKLVATLRSAAKLCVSERDRAQLQHRNLELESKIGDAFGDMVGSSQALRRVQYLIEKAAPTDANVLIVGENGTGKELVARELHRRSRRQKANFVAVDLGALPESLFESEMFGHVRGAYTGAGSAREGRFQAASGGSIFLDEIGNLPLALQPKLLTALERRSVVPVGSDRPVAIDIRVIAATNVTMAQLQDPHKFRADLLYRLNTVEIHVPALRERRGDIPALVQHYLRVFATKYERDLPRVDPTAMAQLEAHAWPGNIRALRHCIERATIMAENHVIMPRDISLEQADPGQATLESAGDEQLDLARLERNAIERAIAKHAGNISQTAKELGITRTALYRRMAKHGL